MTQIEKGIGFIGYYLEGQQELHTGHSSSLATWSKAQRQLVELRGDKPSAAAAAGALAAEPISYM